MSTYWKIFRFFFAFISEVILGKNTFRHAYRYDRRRIYVLLIVTLSLALNFLSIPRLLSISYEYFLLRNQYQELMKDYEELSKMINKDLVYY